MLHQSYVRALVNPEERRLTFCGPTKSYICRQEAQSVAKKPQDLRTNNFKAASKAAIKEGLDPAIGYVLQLVIISLGS